MAIGKPILDTATKQEMNNEVQRAIVALVRDDMLKIIQEKIDLKERFHEGCNLEEVSNTVMDLMERVEGLSAILLNHPELHTLGGPIETQWLELHELLGVIEETQKILA